MMTTPVVAGGGGGGLPSPNNGNALLIQLASVSTHFNHSIIEKLDTINYLF